MSTAKTFEQLLRDRNTAANNVSPLNQLMRITGSRIWDHLPDKQTFESLIQSSKTMAEAAQLPQWQRNKLKRQQIERLIENLDHAMAEHNEPDDEFLNGDQLITLMAELQADITKAASQLAKEVRNHRNIVFESLTTRKDAMKMIALDPLINLISQRELIDFLLTQPRRRQDILRDWVTLNELRGLYSDNSLYHILGPDLCNLMQYSPTLGEIMEALRDDSVNEWIFRSLARRTFSELVVNNTKIIESLLGFTTTTNTQLTDEKLVYLVATFIPHPELRTALVVHIKTNSNARLKTYDEMPVFQFIFQEVIDSVESLQRFTNNVNFTFLLEHFPWESINAVERMQVLMNHPLWTVDVYMQTIRKCLMDFEDTTWLICILRMRIDRLDIFKFIVFQCYGSRFLIEDHLDPLYSDLFEEDDFVPNFTTDVTQIAQLRNPQMSTRTQMIELMIQALAVGQDRHFDEIFEQCMALYLKQDDADKRPDMDLVALMIKNKGNAKLDHYLTLFPSIKNRLTNRQYQNLPSFLQSKFTRPENQVADTLDDVVTVENNDEIHQIAVISSLRQLPLESLDEYRGLFAICNDPTIQMNVSLQAKLEQLLTEMGVPPLIPSQPSSTSPEMMTRKRTRQQREQQDEGYPSPVCQRLRMWQHEGQNVCHTWNGEKTHPLVTWRFPNGRCISLSAMYEYLSNGHFQDPFDPTRILAQTEIVQIFTMYYTRLRFFRLLRDAGKNL